MRGLKKHYPMPLPCHCHAMLQLRTEPQRNGLTRNCCRLPSPATFQLSLWPLPNTRLSHRNMKSRHLGISLFFAACLKFWESKAAIQAFPGDKPSLPGIPPLHALHALHALPCWYSSRLQLSKPRRRHTKRITSTCCKLEVRIPSKTRKRKSQKSGNLWS